MYKKDVKALTDIDEFDLMFPDILENPLILVKYAIILIPAFICYLLLAFILDKIIKNDEVATRASITITIIICLTVLYIIKWVSGAFIASCFFLGAIYLLFFWIDEGYKK